MKKYYTILFLLILFVPSLLKAQDTSRYKVYFWLDNQLYDQAAGYLEKILKDTADAGLANDLARSYYFMKDYNRAAKLLENTLRKNPYDITANRFMANIYELQNAYVNAIPYLRRLADTLPNNALLYRELGNIYLAQDDIDSGKVYLEKAYNNGKKIPSVVASYADYLIKTEQYDVCEDILYTYFAGNSMNTEIIDKMIKVADTRSRDDTITKLCGKYFGKIGSLVNTNALIIKAYNKGIHKK